MNEKQVPVADRCAFSKWTNKKWLNCNVQCVAVECWNRKRIENGRSDGAAFHSRVSDEYLDKSTEERRNAPFILVRSRYCCRRHCVDYVPAEK